MANEPQPQPRQQPRITNEVLEERIANYFDRTMQGIQGLREQLDRYEARLDRLEEGHHGTGQRLDRHENLAHHPHTEKRLMEIEKTQTGMERTLAKMADISKVEAAVNQLSGKVTAIENLQNTQAAQMKGRQEAWSSADKLFLRIVALAGFISTVITILVITGAIGGNS